MAIIRGDRFFTVIALALVGAFILIATHISLAQEKKKISWSAKAENTKVALQQALDIPDIAGHIIRLTEFRRTWPDGGAPTVEGLKVVEDISRGFSDSIAGNGRGSGYSQWRFENGDLMFGEWQNTLQTVANPDRSRKTTFTGTYVTTGGTGRLRGIKGLGRYGSSPKAAG
jgi:hypothetical protein